MSLLRFVVTLDAVERVTAAERLSFMTDTATVSSAAASGKAKGLKEHMSLLEGVLTGDANGNAE